jgi:hypothetical protein
MRPDLETMVRLSVLLGAILLILFLFPLPGQTVPSLNAPDTVAAQPRGNYASALKNVWVSNLALAIIGVVTAGLTWKRMRYWEIVALVFAAVYLFLELINYVVGGNSAVSSLLYFQSNIDVLNAIQMKVRHSEMALRNEMSILDSLKILSRELLLPILELEIFMLLVFRAVTRWRKSGKPSLES